MFTPKQQTTLEYLLKGYTNKEIAREMDIEIVTVKLHMKNICRRLGVKTRTQAVIKMLTKY